MHGSRCQRLIEQKEKSRIKKAATEAKERAERESVTPTLLNSET